MSDEEKPKRYEGERHRMSKLTTEQVEMIRIIYDEGFLGHRKIAKAFGVDRTVIRDIVRFKRRKNG